MNSSRSLILAKLNSNQSDQIFVQPIEEHNGADSNQVDDAPSKTNLLELFCAQAKRSETQVIVVSATEQLGQSIAEHLKSAGFPSDVCSSSESLVKKLNTQGFETVEYRKCKIDEKIALIESYAGIAETGSLVSLSTSNRAVSSAFLPQHSIAVLSARDIVYSLEDMWRKLFSTHTGLPRALNVITGPSRTGDIEQKIHIGAHGPCSLTIFLVN